MYVNVVTKSVDTVPYLGIDVIRPGWYLVNTDDKFPSHHTMRSDDGEIDVTVHFCEVMNDTLAINTTVVGNFVGRGIIIKSETCGTREINTKLNSLIHHIMLGD